MEKIPFKKISEFYDSRVRTYGHGHQACDYGRSESQQLKFAVLSTVCNLSGKTILDVGCGFADYADFIKERFCEVDYSGLDLSSQMIELARLRHPELQLDVGNILDSPADSRLVYDVVNANGIFYLLGENAEETMRRLVCKMFDHARVAVAFNSLSTWADHCENGEFYADPIETIAWCREITPWVVLRHDYLKHDFTVFMFRNSIRA